MICILLRFSRCW